MSLTQDPPAPAPSPAPAPQTTPSPAPGSRWESEFIGPDFTLNHKALERLPDHLKGLKPTLERFKSFEDVLTSYQSQQTLVGKKALAPLPDSAPPEAKAERKQLLDAINGVPPKPADYKIERPTEIPEAYWNPKLAENYMAWAHKHSISPAAAREMMSVQLGVIKEQLASQEQYERDFYAKHDKDFAERIRQDNIPAERASELVLRGAKALGLDTEKQEVQTLLKNADVRTMAMRHAIATGEDRAVDGNATDGGAADPGKQASDIMHNPTNPEYAVYWNREGKFPRAVHEAVVTKVNEWLRKSADKNPSRQRR